MPASQPTHAIVQANTTSADPCRDNGAQAQTSVLWYQAHLADTTADIPPVGESGNGGGKPAPRKADHAQKEEDPVQPVEAALFRACHAQPDVAKRYLPLQ